MNCRFAFLFFTVLASLSAQITGGMLNPALDAKNQPFSYFWRPDDVLGALYAPVASEVTPEGYIWTGFGELMFFTGNPLEPVNQRLRTLQRGYLPIIKYDVVRDSVVYHFRLFAADLGGAMQGIPVNFAEVEIRNDSAEPRTAFLSTGFRVAAPNTGFGSLPDYRFSQRFELIPKRYVDGQTGVNTAWRYHFHSNTLCRDGRILYSFPDGAWQQSLALGDRGFRMVRFFSGEIEGNSNPKLPVNPQTPMGVNTWRIPLKPHETRKLEFKMPLAPIPSDSPEAQQIINANPSEITKQIITQ